ncbi:Ankyrin repeat protein [Penicillium verhagenii]|uniref:Ankyrin repeat protein n=1 Tax=Penicillium verhagenii TaxID=1562060 RepID=UPI0025456D70|nr:Ankyrin repeat protein [Penicillium verhagenii]KAJ5938338.1 Ankyrin repeat protein [Penicillium verhagenii]
MAVPRGSKKAIDEEFERLMAIQEIELDPEALIFLEKASASLGSKNILSLRGPMDRSLLHYAAMGDCVELMRYLLLNHAAVDERDRNKRTPLSWAAESASLNATKLLLLNGAKVNSLDDMYTPPLTWLVYAGPPSDQHAPTKAFLISKGARDKGAKRRWFLKKLHLL